MRALALELVALERLHRQREVVRPELVVVAVDVDPDLAAVAQRGGDVAGVERRDRRGDLRHLLAEARAERAVVRLDLVGAELAGLRDEAQLLDVELVEHDVLHALDRLALLAGGDDDGGAQRLAHLELAVPARGEPEPHRLARDRHRGLEREVARAGLREVGEVDARQAAVEVLVDRVGDERARTARAASSTSTRQVLERAERGRVAVPEAAARAADVPVRELVDERRDRLAGARRVVVLHPVADLGDRRVQPRDRPAVELGLRLARLGHRRSRSRRGRRSRTCSTAAAGTGARTRRPSPSRTGSRPTAAWRSGSTSGTRRRRGAG